MAKNIKQTGFGVLGLFIGIAIILILMGVMYFNNSKNKQNLQTQKNAAAEQVNQANQKLNNYQQQLDNQNR